MTRREAMAWLRALARMSRAEQERVLRTLPQAAVNGIVAEWWWQAHGGQIEPHKCEDGADWRVWAIVAGRGFGKTRAGAEWVWARARENPGARIALVAASLDEVAKVMVEGESGLLSVARCDEAPRWIASRGILEFPSRAVAFAYSAERPGKLRGPQHHFAWCDELAKWPSAGKRGDAAWDNLMLGLRLGPRPRTIVTTTPQSVALLKRVLGLERCIDTRGRTDDNPHLPADFREAVTQMYAGTRLGRQELEGLLLEDVPGALFTRDMLEKARLFLPGLPLPRGEGGGEGLRPSGDDLMPRSPPPNPPPTGEGFGGRAFFKRIVVGVDPPASAHGDACGIVVCGLGGDGLAYVLADLTVSGLRPEGWARRVAMAAELWDAQRIVAEKNQGGDMVEGVLRAAGCPVPVRPVSATKSKAARAEPIAFRFETGEAKLAGCFPDLEDELCAITYGGYEGPSRSPDRADAMVWAMSELFGKPRAEPRILLL
jgi:phage terminase large subunit-like protein